ncbi:hypothetical protein RRG08_048037 [Elysia crispata]|uniref:Uncharacterized protein n=1 Tax=Elysia crispata TaxID=231223 RepID=A0AAE0Z2M1_9GAST|nr:hypothetical protein RRG08_048037 [Elysia crispata]
MSAALLTSDGIQTARDIPRFWYRTGSPGKGPIEDRCSQSLPDPKRRGVDSTTRPIEERCRQYHQTYRGEV